jgi:hypothetical protein
MKLIVKLIIFSALIINPICHHSYASTHVVSLHAPFGIDTENVTCLYHGTPLPFKNQYCILPESGARYFFTLIVTARLQLKNIGSTAILTREPGISCAWYNCSLVYDNQDSYHWKIERVMDPDMPERIPEHCSIIVLIPPQFITGLDDTEKGHSVIHLPKVMLKEDLTQDYLDLAVTNIASQLPDIKCYCSGQNMCICKRNSTVVMAPEHNG